MLELERENFVQYWMRQLHALFQNSVSVDFFSSPENFDQIKHRSHLGQNDFNFRILFPQIKSPYGIITTPVLQITLTWQLVQRFIGPKELRDSHKEALAYSQVIFNQVHAIDVTQLNEKQPEMQCVFDEQRCMSINHGPAVGIKPPDRKER